ncbi:MAG: fimbrillin family protein [Mucinivorans sp.]
MVRKIHIALLFALAGMVCVACVPERIVEPIPEGKQEISFAPPTATDPTADRSASRGTIATAANLPSFGVFASLGKTWTAATSTPNYIYNSKVIKVGTSTTWRCDPPQYWPPAASGSLSFFAYAPYAPAGLTFSAATAAGIPTLTYQTPEAVDEQVDLLFAAPAYDQVYNSTQNVPMNFTHILSAITFSARLKDALAAGFSRLSVRGVAISGLNTQGTYTYGTPGAWASGAGTPQIYSVSVDGGQLVAKELTTTAQSISATSKIMIAIPQTIPAAAKIAVRMQYYADGSAIPQELTVEKQLNIGALKELAIANKYNIVLSVSLGTLNDVNVSYSVIGWTDKGEITIPPID